MNDFIIIQYTVSFSCGFIVDVKYIYSIVNYNYVITKEKLYVRSM